MDITSLKESAQFRVAGGKCKRNDVDLPRIDHQPEGKGKGFVRTLIETSLGGVGLCAGTPEARLGVLDRKVQVRGGAREARKIMLGAQGSGRGGEPRQDSVSGTRRGAALTRN